ncbi:MAG: polysaccharide deacetylase family protein [Rhodobacteraceae bacterium]|nr:polysaccharide deacetylase family protein [Paracoccaceae bacterium]
MPRRAVLGFGLAAVLAPALPGDAEAQPAIALPKDMVGREPSTIASVRTSQPLVALTFDDGPHPKNTPRLLDMLREQKARATFYVIGERVATKPKLAARIAEEGHEIGNHSWSHPNLSGYSDTAVLSQIDRTSMAIWHATGRPPVTFRPPYGAFSQRQRRMQHGVRKLPSILWDVDPRDWKRPGAALVAQRILAGSHQGSIILSHDIHWGTVEAMPSTLNGLIGRGLRLTSVSEIIGWPRWQNRRFRQIAAPGA